MKVLVWNAASLAPTVKNAVLKHGSWLGFFKHHGLDLLCVQESKVNEDKLGKELACVEGFQSFWAFSRARKGYSGVTTYASTDYAPVGCEADCLGSGDDDIDREGRVVMTDHQHFVLFNVYVPNAGDRPARPRLEYKLRFLEALKRKADALVAAGREVMLVGDFNIPAEPRDMHPELGPYSDHYSEEERAALAGLMASYPDVWRRLHPEESSTYTVWEERKSHRPLNRGLRIDYVLVSPGLLDKVASCEVLSAEVLPPKWSDHAGILLEMRDVPPLPPHPPCPRWADLHRRFNQRSIADMFAAKKRSAEGAAGGAAAAQPAAAPEAGKASSAAAAAAAAAAGVQEEEPAAKKARQGGGAAEAGAEGAAHAEDAAAIQQQQQQQSNGGAAACESDKKAAAGKQQQAQRPSSGGRKGKQASQPDPGQRTIGSFFKK